MAVAIARSDVSTAELRGAAGRTQDAKAARRMLAIALVLDGWSRESAAEACAMDRQTLRDWVHRLYGAHNVKRMFLSWYSLLLPVWRHSWTSWSTKGSIDLRGARW